MLEFIKRRGSVSFDALMRREMGRDYEYDEKYEAKVMNELGELVGSGSIEVYRTAVGHTNYRTPLEKVSKKEYDPITRMARVADPEGAQRLFDDVIKYMDEEGFTVNGVYKAQDEKTKLPSGKVRDLIDELASMGKIVATKSKMYMGRPYNIYEVVAGAGVVRKKKRKVSQG